MRIPSPAHQDASVRSSGCNPAYTTTLRRIIPQHLISMPVRAPRCVDVQERRQSACTELEVEPKTLCDNPSGRHIFKTWHLGVVSKHTRRHGKGSMEGSAEAVQRVFLDGTDPPDLTKQPDIEATRTTKTRYSKHRSWRKGTT